MVYDVKIPSGMLNSILANLALDKFVLGSIFGTFSVVITSWFSFDVKVISVAISVLTILLAFFIKIWDAKKKIVDENLDLDFKEKTQLIELKEKESLAQITVEREKLKLEREQFEFEQLKILSIEKEVKNKIKETDEGG